MPASLSFPLMGGNRIFYSNSAKSANQQTPMKFHIIDSPMGIGKSATIIDVIRFHNEGFDPEPRRFIVFVPTVRERDERYMRELDLKCPETPPYNKSILELIRNGENIVTTHALWSIFNDETLQAFKQSKFRYIAIFDEVPPLFRDVVGAGPRLDEPAGSVRFGPADIKLMQQNGMIRVKNGVIEFNSECEYAKTDADYKVFNAVKNLSYSCTLYPYGEKDGLFTSIIAFARRDLFSCFRECWFFSYLTYDSMLHKYCVMNHIGMDFYQIVDRRMIRNPGGRFMETYPDSIENLVILDDKRFNIDGSLSKQWYSRASRDPSQEGLKQLKQKFRNAYEFMKAHGVRTNTFMFTTFNAYKELLRSNGAHYPSLRRFLPCNTKATNDYSNCTGVAYLCNRFFDVTCVNFLAQRAKAENNPELKFNDDNYALSELVQFIWRSNVRITGAHQPVYVWVPDRRMRTLLQDFQMRALKAKEKQEHLQGNWRQRTKTPALKRKLAGIDPRKCNLTLAFMRLKYFRLRKIS